MRITENHLLEGARYVPVLKTHAPMPVRRFLVMHFTAGATGQSSIDFWKDGAAASAHFVIERDGSITQCVPCNVQAWHAGSSAWTDPNTGIRYHGLNACSIGIELANAGNSPGALSWARRQPGFKTIIAKHPLRGGPPTEWECFPDAQLEAAHELAAALVARYRLDDVTGHENITTRKSDPGPAFPLEAFRRRLGYLAPLP